MLKRYITLLLCLFLMVFLISCTPMKSGTITPSLPHNETKSEPTMQEAVELPGESAGDKAESLALEDFRENPVTYNFEEDSILNTSSIDLPHTTLNEQSEVLYNNEKELDILVHYVHDELGVEIDGSWKVFVHYYDADKTVGMVQFLYTVGEINTNRSIVFNIHGNQYDTVYYKCLTGDIDEADLTDRIHTFQSKYFQEKRQLQDGEHFYEEHTAYTYYIHSDTLVYSYSYFFQYDMGVINNDWGTERIIDENGCAVAIG